MEDEAQVMRLPRYARGLQIVRIGVIGMLLQLFMAIALILKSLTASTPEDATEVINWIKYTQWVNMAVVGAMFAGSILAIPDFIASKMSLWRIAVAVIGFGIVLLTLWWAYSAIAGFIKVAVDREGDLDELIDAAEKLKSLPLLTVVKDLAYVIGLFAIVRSVRQTAVANDHHALRDASSQVSGLIGIMLVADIIYQMLYGVGAGSTIAFALIGLLFGIAVLVYWVYCHLRLQKFLKAAAILVHEPHNLPVARIVTTAATAKPAPHTSGPIKPVEPIKPSAPINPSAPIIPVPRESMPSQPVMVVRAELPKAPVPRADTAPGAPESDGPKFLK